MLLRAFSLVCIMLLFSACAGGNKKSAGHDSGANQTGAPGSYQIASEGLPVFEVIKGSETGARAGDRVFFDFDSAALGENSRRTLDRQADWLKSNAQTNITVEGHCDERGTREYNLALGEKRANAVKKYLVSSGISASRITTVSYGKERPAVLGSNPAAWAENRRSVTVLK